MRLLILLGLLVVILSAVNGQQSTTCPENETYLSCGPSCQTECATLNKPCLIRNFRCPDGCYCNEGFARRATDNSCIPKDTC